MWSYVYMALLERRPATYDARMARVSRGRIRAVKDTVVLRLAEARPEGGAVLELGCGTGELAALLATRGFRVHGLDASPGMIDVARTRVDGVGLGDAVQLEVRGVDGMDDLEGERYDAVVSTLMFSALSDAERRWALRHSHRVLRRGGTLVLADEVQPRTTGGRVRHALGRAPALAVTYLITGRASRPLVDVRRELEDAGFAVASEERSHRDGFAVVTAERAP